MVVKDETIESLSCMMNQQKVSDLQGMLYCSKWTPIHIENNYWLYNRLLWCREENGKG